MAALSWKRARRMAPWVVALSVVGVLTWGYVASQPEGNPDPGFRRMMALAPVLSVAPSDARHVSRNLYPSTWDMCDGDTSTLGWGEMEAIVEWSYNGHPRQVFAHVDLAMRALGWKLDASSETGQWTWFKTVDGNI